jgi:hypothetical protein
MLNKYKKPGNALFIGKIMHDMKKMKAELKDHRYGLERNVELRTAHLLTRIALLESCNATLCSKLEQAKASKQPDANAAKLYVMGTVANLQDKWCEQATAA